MNEWGRERESTWIDRMFSRGRKSLMVGSDLEWIELMNEHWINGWMN